MVVVGPLHWGLGHRRRYSLALLLSFSAATDMLISKKNRTAVFAYLFKGACVFRDCVWGVRALELNCRRTRCGACVLARPRIPPLGFRAAFSLLLVYVGVTSAPRM